MALAQCILLIGSFLGHSTETQILQDLEYARVGERSLKLDLYIPHHDEGTRLPLVVWVHGGAWVSGDRADPRTPRELGDRYIVASIDYRLSTEAAFPAQIYDCKAAIRWLRANADRYDIDPDRIGAWGGSAGGHLVALLGTSEEVEELEGDVGNHLDRSSAVQAVCDFYGPIDLASLYEDTAKMDPRKNPLCLLFGGIPTEYPDLLLQANPITHVSSDDPPFLIMHGDKDLVVPLAQSELLYAALQEAGVESTLRVIEGCAHGGFPPDAYEEVRRFFDEHLAVTAVGET
jgi:acetyl esterase/lipase